MGNLLYWAVVFLIIAIVGAALGFGGVAGTAMEGSVAILGGDRFVHRFSGRTLPQGKALLEQRPCAKSRRQLLTIFSFGLPGLGLERATCHGRPHFGWLGKGNSWNSGAECPDVDPFFMLVLLLSVAHDGRDPRVVYGTFQAPTRAIVG